MKWYCAWCGPTGILGNHGICGWCDFLEAMWVAIDEIEEEKRKSR